MTSTTVSAPRNTLAVYERIIKAAARQGRLAIKAIHYPDGRVEFIFSDPEGAAAAPVFNPWDQGSQSAGAPRKISDWD